MNSNDWICKGGMAVRPAPFCPIGILNITPDSFSDGTGTVPCTDLIVERARAMHTHFLSWGCGMLDLGAESTRPDSRPVNAQEELARLVPPLKKIRIELPEVPISIDTCRADVAATALDIGAHVINDVSACCRDPELMDILVQYQPGYVLTHGGVSHFTRHMTMADELAPGEHPVDGILRFFEQQLTRLTRAGLAEDHIVLDPGIGFGKTGKENWAILSEIEQLTTLGRPLYVGLSRKSLFGWLLGLEPAERDTVTQTTVALLAARGIPYHRVHDVEGTIASFRIASAMAEQPTRRKTEDDPKTLWD